MKKYRFALGLFIYALIMVLGILAGLFVFWQYIAAFEFSQIDGAMEKYMVAELGETIDREIGRFAKEHETELESADDVATVLHTAVDAGELTYRKAMDEYTQQTPVYSVRLDGQELGRVYFRPYAGGPFSFGFDYWFANRSEFDFERFALEYTVIAPEDAAVTVNGEAVTPQNCSVSWDIPEELDLYASELAEQPRRAHYSFRAFSEPKVGLPSGSEEYSLSADESAPNVFNVTRTAPNDELSGQLYQYAENFVRAYIAYTSNANRNYGVVTGYMVYDSSLYKRMVAAREGLNWVRGVTGYLSELSVDSLQYYGCAATLEAHYVLVHGAKQSDNDMKIVLTQTDMGWKVAGIEL